MNEPLPTEPGLKGSDMSEQGERLRSVMRVAVDGILDSDYQEFSEGLTDEEIGDKFLAILVTAIVSELGITEEMVGAVRVTCGEIPATSVNNQKWVLVREAADALFALMEVGNG